MIKFALSSFLLFSTLSACSTYIHIPNDNKWHSLVAIQAVDQDNKELTQRYSLESLRDTQNLDCHKNQSIQLQVRLVYIPDFGDYSKLPDETTNPAPPSWQDSGPLDFNLAGAVKVITVGTGYELLAKSNQDCGVIKLTKFHN